MSINPEIAAQTHPAETIGCPTCGAKAGVRCRGAWMGKWKSPHRSRWIAAGLIDAGDRVPETLPEEIDHAQQH